MKKSGIHMKDELDTNWSDSVFNCGSLGRGKTPVYNGDAQRRSCQHSAADVRPDG